MARRKVYSPRAEWNQVVDMIVTEAIDHFMPNLSSSAWKILSTIISQTLIRRKRNISTSYAQLQKTCGRGVQSSATINRAIQELLKAQHLIRFLCPAQNTYTYRLNIRKLMQISACEKVRCEKEHLSQELKQIYRIQKRNQFQAQRAQIAPGVLERDHYQCQYCGAREHLTLDHIVPISKGGHPTDPANLIVACQSCNSRKRDRLPSEAEMAFQLREGVNHGKEATD